MMTPTLNRPLSLLSSALVIGLLSEQLLLGRSPGLAFPLLVGLLLLALRWLARVEARKPTTRNWLIGAGAMVFAIMLAVRAAPWITILNLLAVCGLLILHATLYRAERISQLEVWRISAGVFTASIHAFLQPLALLINQSGRLNESGLLRRSLVLIRGTLLAMPVLLLFAALLSEADSIFAAYVETVFRWQRPFELAPMLRHSMTSLLIAWALAGGLLVALSDHPVGTLLGPQPGSQPAEGETQRLRYQPRFHWLGMGETLIVLSLVACLFAAFMVIQGAYLFGGRDTLERTGMTFAEYARRGFFELVLVACLALGILWALNTITRRSAPWHARAFGIICSLIVVLVLGMLSSAAYRMWLYEQAYGYTLLRLLTFSWMVWLASILVLFLASVLYDRPRWFSLGLPAAALCYLLALNMMNPEAMIVRENIAHYRQTGKLDREYLMRLSPDAAIALIDLRIAAIISADSENHHLFQRYLERQRDRLIEQAEVEGWASWNLGRSRAIMAGSNRYYGATPTAAVIQQDSSFLELAGDIRPSIALNPDVLATKSEQIILLDQ